MNRIVNNVIIIDSAMGNAFILTSGNQVIHLEDLSVNAFAFLSNGSTSTISISALDTTNVVYSESFLTMGAISNNGVIIDNFKFRPFGNPQRFSDLKVPTLTAGTGFIYLA